MAQDCISKMPAHWSEVLKSAFCDFEKSRPPYPFQPQATSEAHHNLASVFVFSSEDDGNYGNLCRATQFQGFSKAEKPQFRFDPKKYMPHSSEVWQKGKGLIGLARSISIEDQGITDNRNVVGIEFIETVPNGDEGHSSEGSRRTQNFYVVVSRQQKRDCSPPIAGNNVTDHGRAINKISQYRVGEPLHEFLGSMNEYKGSPEPVVVSIVPGNVETHCPDHRPTCPQLQCEWVPYSKVHYEGGKLLFDLESFAISQQSSYTFTIVAGHSKANPMLQFSVSREALLKGGTLVFAHDAANPLNVLKGEPANATPSLFRIGIRLYQNVTSEQWGMTTEPPPAK